MYKYKFTFTEYTFKKQYKVNYVIHKIFQKYFSTIYSLLLLSVPIM